MMRWRNLDSQYSDRLAVVRAQQPHEILGVPMDCSPAGARKAYLGLVKAYHPDRTDPFMACFNEEMIKIVNLAYEQFSARGSR